MALIGTLALLLVASISWSVLRSPTPVASAPPPAPKTSPPSQPPPRTIQVDVSASQGWTDSLADLQVGSSVSITANGVVKIATRDPGKTPAGDPNCILTGVDYTGQNFVADYLPCWSLIGRIGDGPAFAVGSSTSFVPTESGRLYLGVSSCE
ncbi:MAG: hypothetical protein ACRDRK_16815 [Pseudonocardia sp.]